MQERYIRHLKTLIVIIFATFGVVYVQAVWTEPTAPPPGDNTPPPVNVGNTNQTKSGGLGVGNFVANGNAQVTGFVQIGETNAGCTVDVEGAQRYNKTTKVMEFCNGTEWCNIDGGCNPAPPSSPDPTVDTSSCRAIYETGGSTGNGTYTIDPDGVGSVSPFEVYCSNMVGGPGTTNPASCPPAVASRSGLSFSGGSRNPDGSCHINISSPYGLESNWHSLCMVAYYDNGGKRIGGGSYFWGGGVEARVYGGDRDSTYRPHSSFWNTSVPTSANCTLGGYDDAY